MTDAEYQTHMSLWSMLSAPLIAGNDLRDMTPAIHDILTNREVVAIDQDKDGKQATRTSKSEDQEIWVNQLADGGQAERREKMGPGVGGLGHSERVVAGRWVETQRLGRPRTSGPGKPKLPARILGSD